MGERRVGAGNNVMFVWIYYDNLGEYWVFDFFFGANFFSLRFKQKKKMKNSFPGVCASNFMVF